jgi:hypothetical protein
MSIADVIRIFHFRKTMRYIYLSILSGDLCSNFACYIAPLKTFIIQKIKKFCNAKKIFIEEYDIFAFYKKMALQNFFIFCTLLAFLPSKIMHEKKLGVIMFLFQLYETIGHFGVNFVHVCRHSNEISVTKTNII